MSSRTSWHPSVGFVAAVVIAVLLGQTTGCTDGPMFQLKKLNPYIQHQWKKDREKVVVFSERIEEIQLLRSQIASMPAPEQEQWVSELESMLKKETSPEIRRESIQVLEVVHHRPDAIAAIAPYSKDKNEKVRLAVVDALRKSD